MRPAAKWVGSLLCGMVFLAGLAACGAADKLDYGDETGVEGQSGVAQGAEETAPPKAPIPQEADNYNLVTLNGGTLLAGCTAAGGDEGFYQTVQSGDGKATYFLYTDYETQNTRWLADENGMPVRIASNGSDVAVLPAGDIVLVLRLGYYEQYDWGTEQLGGQLYTMNPDGTGLRLVLELDAEMDRRVFWPASAVVYDGEGIYCNVAHYNGAKGTADMMLMYIYEDGRYPVEMKYYSMEDPGGVPLLAGSFGDTMIVRTARGNDFDGPGTVSLYEESETSFSYALYHYTSGGLEEPVATYKNSEAAGILDGTHLYTVYWNGVAWYDFATGESGWRDEYFGVSGGIRPAKTTAQSHAAPWNHQLVVSAGMTAWCLDTDSDEGWRQTFSYSPAEYFGAVWAAPQGHYVVAASEPEADYYTAGMPLFGLAGEPEDEAVGEAGEEHPGAEPEPEETAPEWVTDTALPVWLVWPFPEERPADMTLYLLAEAEGYWEGTGEKIPLLPNG